MSSAALVELAAGDPDEAVRLARTRERMLECFRIKGYEPGLQAYS